MVGLVNARVDTYRYRQDNDRISVADVAENEDASSKTKLLRQVLPPSVSRNMNRLFTTPGPMLPIVDPFL